MVASSEGADKEESGPWPLELKESELEGVAEEAAAAREGALPTWGKVSVAATLAVLVVLIIGGGAAAPRQQWLSNAGPASAAYFSAGTASVGVISCSSGIGMGFFSIGLVSFGIVGSVGIFSVGFFSIGFFSIGVFSFGHIALGVWACGAYSRWMHRGQGWTDGDEIALVSCLPPKTNAQSSEGPSLA